MLQVLRVNQRSIALFVGVCMLLSAVAGGIGLCYAKENETEGAVSLSVKAESGGEGESGAADGEVWAMYLSQSLYRVTQGGNMVLLLTAEASEGWRIRRVEAGEGAEGLTLTVGETPCAEVSVLLDGRVTEDTEGGESRPILRFFLEKDPEKPADRGGYMGVTAGKYGDLALYYADAEGKITEIPLVFESHTDGAEWETSSAAEPSETEEETRTTPPPVGEDETDREGSDQEGTGGEESRHESDPRPAEPPKQGALGNTFMGCRETDVRDGEFAVQFLFCGNGKDTPVVCMAGGGVITVEVSCGQVLDVPLERVPQTGMDQDARAWSLCTFRGLSVEGEYVFLVFTEKGTVAVGYSEGKFCGYG